MDCCSILVGYRQWVKASTLIEYVADTFDEGVDGRSQSGSKFSMAAEYRLLVSISVDLRTRSKLKHRFRYNSSFTFISLHLTFIQSLATHSLTFE